MKRINHLRQYLLFCSLLAIPSLSALGKNTTNTGSGSTQVSSSMENFLLNLGIFYSKTNPQVAPYLTALGINNGNDLKRLIRGDLNGSNFQDIITSAALQYVYKDPKYQGLFQQLGVTDFASLKALLTSGNSANTDLLLNIAFNYMSSNPEYQLWMSQLGINDASDLRGLIFGTGQSTDLKAILLNFAMIYAQSNPKYAPYIFLISALLGNDTTPVDISNPFLGAYDGLSPTEIKRVQGAKKIKL